MHDIALRESRRGTAYGVLAYLLWGLFPLYWPLLAPAGALEVLAHRVLWSLVVVLVLLQVTRGWSAVGDVVRDRGRLAKLAAAAVLVSINWGTYIYGVTSNHVVETSLGYFVNPLVSVLLGVVVLGERLRPAQKFAVAAALVAVVVLSIENGRPPWIALVLAFSFGFYGLLKKQAGVAAVPALAVETAVLAPVAALFLTGLGVTGRATFTGHGLGHPLLLALAGVVTAVPLLAFAGAANRVPLSTLGVLQYLAPTMQFLLGVLLFHEPLGLARLLGFCLVWLALVVFTADLLGERRRQTRRTVLAPA